MKKVNILGTEYTILVKKYDEDEAFDRRSICGYCDELTKRIVLCDVSTYKGWEHEPEETVIAQNMQTLRHEIVHAFLYESGLEDSSFAYDGGWAKNEEMVDWIANQGPKIFAAWMAAGAVKYLPGAGLMTYNVPIAMDHDELMDMLNRDRGCHVFGRVEGPV